MCGICGYYSNITDKKVLKDMTNSISHRGPDGEGYFSDKKIGMGHRRLSIIDLKKGKQPMHFENFVVVYNGEIYNFKELRRDLEKKGYVFETKSDTEVILKLYKEYGKKCLNYLNGMFSFVIYDIEEKSLFLARDRLGIKPLYYYFDGKSFVFSSEIKSLLKFPEVKREINKDSLYEFIFRQYISKDDTIFKGIKKLEPGNYIFFHKNKLTVEKYWDLRYTNEISNEPEAISKIKKQLEDSVKLRLIADVPIGVFLSGGLDSSVILSIMNKFKGEGIKTFSVGFNESGYGETKYSRLISETFKTNHEEIILDSSSVKKLDKVIEHLDEPLSDFASLPTYYLSEMASKKVKVVLTGEGGDENFGGYDYYNKFKIANKIFNRNLLLKKKVFAYNFNKYLNFNSSKYLQSKLVNYSKGNLLNEMLKWDTKIWLPDDLLMKVDKMTMAHGLEARVPFLDHKFMELTASLDPKFKNKKLILRKAFSKEIPKAVLERKKHGFEVPVRLWFDRYYREKIDELIDRNQDLLKEYFVYAEIKKMLNNKRDNLFIWRIYNFLIWAEKYL